MAAMEKKHYLVLDGLGPKIRLPLKAECWADLQKELKADLEEIFESRIFDDVYEDVYPCGYYEEPMQEAAHAFDRIEEKRLRHASAGIWEDDDRELMPLDLHVYYRQWAAGYEKEPDGLCIAVARIDKGIRAFMAQGIWQFGLLEKVGRDARREKEIRKGERDPLAGRHIIAGDAPWPTPRQAYQQFFWKLKNRMYDPILWFGMRHQPPVSIWTIRPADPDFDFDAWTDALWEENAWSAVCNLREDFNDRVIYWAEECGCRIPARSDVLENCPIKLYDSQMNETEASAKNRELLRRLNSLALEHIHGGRKLD
jgi:hypothetical protein